MKIRHATHQVADQLSEHLSSSSSSEELLKHAAGWGRGHVRCVLIALDVCYLYRAVSWSTHRMTWKSANPARISECVAQVRAAVSIRRPGRGNEDRNRSSGQLREHRHCPSWSGSHEHVQIGVKLRAKVSRDVVLPGRCCVAPLFSINLGVVRWSCGRACPFAM